MASAVAWLVAAVGLCVGLSALFSAAETALFSLSKAQLQQLRQAHPCRGQVILFLLDHPRSVLSTILLGNAVANTASCVLALLLFDHHFAITVAVMIGVLLVLGEIVPKTFAIQNARLTVTLTARPIYWLTRLSAPLRRLLEKPAYWLVSRLTPQTYRPQPLWSAEELHTLLDMGREQGVLSESEWQMIHAILKLGDKRVKEVMTPRVDMISVPDNLAREELTALLRQIKHRRVPVYHETADTVVGILDVKKYLMSPDKDLTEIMDVPAYVPDRMNAGKLLRNFQQQKRQLAVVVDEFGGTEGLVTVEDIIEEIVGEVSDEYDEPSLRIQQVGPHRFAVDGRTSLDEVRERLGLTLTAEGVDTVGGFFAAQCGRVPRTGETLHLPQAVLTASRVVRNRVREVWIERRGTAP